MNRKEFYKTYIDFLKIVIKLKKIAVKHGVSALECEIDDLDSEDFKKGLRFVVDDFEPCVIEEVFNNIISFTKDKNEKQFKAVIKRAVLGIRKKERLYILLTVLNSYANLSKEEELQVEKLTLYSERKFDEDENIIPEDKSEFSKLILKLDDRTIQKALREIDSYNFSVSLKNQSHNVRNKIFSLISRQAAFMIEEDMDYQNPDQEMIDEAQKRIIDIIRRQA